MTEKSKITNFSYFAFNFETSYLNDNMWKHNKIILVKEWVCTNDIVGKSSFLKAVSLH